VLAKVELTTTVWRESSGERVIVVWKPWAWPRSSNDCAVGNARAATTELSRLRLERQDVELFLEVFLERHHADRSRPIA
jgi:hypothetical protein